MSWGPLPLALSLTSPCLCQQSLPGWTKAGNEEGALLSLGRGVGLRTQPVLSASPGGAHSLTASTRLSLSWILLKQSPKQVLIWKAIPYLGEGTGRNREGEKPT